MQAICFGRRAKSSRELGDTSNILRVFLLIQLTLIAFVACSGFAQTLPAVGEVIPEVYPLRDTFRQPWESERRSFLSKWLVCGDFPNPPKSGQKLYDQTPPCVGLETDYLAAAGGEEKIRPVAGDVIKRPDGTEAIWNEYETQSEAVDFRWGYDSSRPKTNVVAYGFTTIHSPDARTVAVGLGTQHGVRVWLNGKLVHENLVERKLSWDADMFDISLLKGQNTLLVKLENGGGALGMYFRVFDSESVQRKPLTPDFNPEEATGLVRITTDRNWYQKMSVRPEITFDALGTGGTVIATQKAQRGDVITFDTKGWKEGSYEFRCFFKIPNGDIQRLYYPWYKGDAIAAAKKAIEAARHADQTSPDGMLQSMLADMLRDRGGENLDKAVPKNLYSPLAELDELSQARSGGTGGRHASGFVRLAWRDDVDNSPQFCRTYLPLDFDPTDPNKKYPLVVFLHGYDPENPSYVSWSRSDLRHSAMAEKYGVIVAESHGRGNTGYRGIGEMDVMRCVAEAGKRFPIDPERIYLTGESMGGGGTWVVGTHRPDVFAAIAPVFGGWDWRAIVTERRLAKLGPADQLQLDRESSFAQAESLLTTPVFINHGDADARVNPEYSRYAARMLQRWGYDVRYWEHPGLGHGQLSYVDAVYPWLFEHTLVRSPTKVRLRAAGLKTAHSHWVRVMQRADNDQFIAANAELTGPNVARIESQNATEITLTPDGPMIDVSRPLHVVWNGADLGMLPFQGGAVLLRDPSYQPGPLVKTPAICGPIDDVCATPFMIIEGTRSSDKLMGKFCHTRAQQIIAHWHDWQHVTPRSARDVDVSDVDLSKYSLILIGGADENAVTAKFADRLPLRIVKSMGESKGSIEIDGKTCATGEGAVNMVYPNPLNPARYVQVIAATSPKAMYWTANLDDDQDWSITDGRIGVEATDDGNEDDGLAWRKVLVARGSFDHAWHLTDALTINGDAKIRSVSPVGKVPSIISAAQFTGDQLPLSDLLEQSASGCFEGFCRDINNQNQPINLGGKRYASGIATGYWRPNNYVDFDLSGSQFKHFRAVVGMELDPALKQETRTAISLRCIVRGDGKQLFSENLTAAHEVAPVDVDVSGVKVLRLEVTNDPTARIEVQSIDWADARLVR